MKRILKATLPCLALIMSVGFSHSVLAYTGWCAAGSDTRTPGIGTAHQYIFSLNTTVSDVTKITPGQTIRKDWDEGGTYVGWCDNEPGVKTETWFKANPGPQLTSEAPGNARFYYIPGTDNTLSVQTHIYIVGHGELRVPLNDASNLAPDDHSKPGSHWSSGGEGYIIVRIEKELASSRIVIPPTVVAELWGSHTKGSYGPSPMVQVIVSGSIIVPQSCTINAGSTLSIDLGNAWAADFKVPGAKPDTYEPKVITVKAHCDNVHATEQLSLGMEATAAAGGYGAIKTTNDNIGIMLSAQSAQSPETQLLTSDPSIRVPFLLDTHNGEATITLKSWPVKVSSDDPAPGSYSATALLDVYVP
ncbi:fimbrial protein [Citrobacter sp. Cb019]|uniref:fimbrial protein n=1 Tax=unclassified Citrobacter TaxID=2644389 RepID=UPI002579D8BF|nr:MULTISPECIES: fimbrial protein [unclassified Citrobacter]MDM3404681.1 fimbrial protein [Citrobacter sp. Cb019]MDM3424398.1 fimbrial protein [Citrobacter sp. Cb026]